MTTLRERAEDAVAAAKAHKADVVATDPDGEVRPIVIAWRGGQEVVTVHLVGALQGGRDIVPIADQIATSFRADCLAVVNETWSATGEGIDPDTGKEWAPGGMGAFVERHGRNNGVVRESLQALVVNSAGDHVTGWAPFEVHQTAFGSSRVDWLEPHFLDSTKEGGSSGWMVDELVRALGDAASVAATLGRLAAEGGLDPEIADAASDAAAVKVLQSVVSDVVALLSSSPDQPRRTEYLEGSLGQPMRDTVEGAFEVAKERMRRGEG